MAVTYLSEHLSLAALEILAHAEDVALLESYVALKVTLPDTELSEASELPEDWQDNPPPKSTREIGRRWFNEGKTLLLKVPSALIPSEHNYLVNPNHADFAKIEVAEPFAFAFDARVLRARSE